MAKFKAKDLVCARPGNESKYAPVETIEVFFTLAVEEERIENTHGAVAHRKDVPWSTIHKTVRKMLHLDPYKIKHVQEFNVTILQ